MEVSAKLRFLRISPRKVRLVTDLVRGKTLAQAEAQLAFLAKHSARPVLKLIQSAAANAENNFKLKKETLYIKKIFVDMGPSLKRWRPRAFGRAAPIVKRSSHITVILDEHKVADKKTKKSAKTTVNPSSKKVAAHKPVAQTVVDFKDIKHAAKGRPEAAEGGEEQKKKPFINFKNIKDSFTRKTGEK